MMASNVQKQIQTKTEEEEKEEEEMNKKEEEEERRPFIQKILFCDVLAVTLHETYVITKDPEN